MVTWRDFANDDRDLAALGLAQLFQFGVGLAFLATVRRDGAPRVHPVCPVLSGGRLYVFIPPGSPKRADLLHDGRFALQAFPQPRKGSDEFYVSGKAEHVDDAATRAAVAAAAGHFVGASELLFELTIDRAMHTRWDEVGTPEIAATRRRWHAPAPQG